MLVLDTTVPGRPLGVLCDDRLRWLEDALNEDAARPALALQHHPPFETGIAHMDTQRLLDGAAEELRLLAGYARLRHLACGHVHRAVTAVVQGVSVSIAPSPAHAVTLAPTPDAPETFTLEPAQIRLFHLGAAGDLVSHLAPIEPWAGPYPFRGADGRLL